MRLIIQKPVIKRENLIHSIKIPKKSGTDVDLYHINSYITYVMKNKKYRRAYHESE